MANLIDYSLIIIALAVVGFLFKEIFYFYQKFCTPYLEKNTCDNTFGYISIAVLIIGACWIALIFSGISNPEFIKNIFNPLFEGIQKFVDLNLISENDIIVYTTKITLILLFFTWLSSLFVYALFITLILGIVSIYLDTTAIEVRYVDSSKQSQTYKRIIKESDYFFYFENLNNFRKWESVRKSEILSINNINSKSKLDNILQQKIPHIIQKNPYICDGKKRRFIIVISLLIPLIFAIFSEVSEFSMIKILIIIFCVPTIVLIFIDSAMREIKK